MKSTYKLLIICIAIPLLVGGLASFISRGSMEVFAAIDKPPLSPPGWLFPIVWTVLYMLMGLASYLVLTSDADYNATGTALKFYGLQLVFNFFWTFWFFNLSLYWFAFAWLIALLVLIFITIIMFYQIDKNAAYLLIPYFLWCLFAAYLNLGIAIIN